MLSEMAAPDPDQGTAPDPDRRREDGPAPDQEMDQQQDPDRGTTPDPSGMIRPS